MKTIIIALAALTLVNSAHAGFAIVNGRQVWFGQSGHWAIEYPGDSDEDQRLIYRGEGDQWSFQDEDQGEE